MHYREQAYRHRQVQGELSYDRSGSCKEAEFDRIIAVRENERKLFEAETINSLGGQTINSLGRILLPACRTKRIEEEDTETRT